MNFNIRDESGRIATWVWAVVGIIGLLVVYMISRGGTTTSGSVDSAGQSSDITGLLSDMQKQIADLATKVNAGGGSGGTTAIDKIKVVVKKRTPMYNAKGKLIGNVPIGSYITAARVKINGMWLYKILTGKFAGYYIPAEPWNTYTPATSSSSSTSAVGSSNVSPSVGLPHLSNPTDPHSSTIIPVNPYPISGTIEHLHLGTAVPGIPSVTPRRSKV